MDLLESLLPYKLDLYVQASKGEAMSISVFQAFAASVPVLASRVVGLKEIINEKKREYYSSNKEIIYEKSKQYIKNNNLIHGDKVLAYKTEPLTEVDTFFDFNLLEFQLKNQPNLINLFNHG